MKTQPDELIRAIRKARKGNPVDVLGKLLAEESRWKRKRTIAENKLASVRDKINQFAKDRAKITANNPVLPL